MLDYLSIRFALEHRLKRNLQRLADLEQARCAHAVSAAFVFLNLLKRDAQHLAEALLAHIEREPAFAHPNAYLGVDDARGPRRFCLSLCFLHAVIQPSTSWKKQYPRAPISRSTSEWSGDLPAGIRTQSLRLTCAGKPAPAIVAKRNVRSVAPRYTS